MISQGRVRTKTVKRSARVIVERYYMKLATDFHSNKRVCDDVATLPSKRMRNKIAGFITVRLPVLPLMALSAVGRNATCQLGSARIAFATHAIACATSPMFVIACTRSISCAVSSAVRTCAVCP